jgi:uncharacterized repeat protein (TIGR02543 family)
MTGPDSGQSAVQDGKAAVRVAIAASGALARTVFPVVELDDVEDWELWGGAPAEAQTRITKLSGTSVTVYLETGVWDFTVKGSKDGAVILQGTLPNQTINLEGEITLNFKVAPVLDETETGTVRITIELPGGHGITKAEVWKDDSLIEGGSKWEDGDTVIVEGDYPAGDYYFSVRLYKDAALYGVVSELVKVRANLISEGTYTLNAADLNIIYIISYDLDGGELASPNPGYYRSTDAAFELPMPTRKGYTFEGWHAETSGGPKAADIPQGTMGDKHFYAEWKIITYGISYVLGDEGSGDGGNPSNYTIEELPLTLKDPIPKGSFRFLYWYVEGSSDIPVTAIPVNSTGEKTYHAKWIPQYTVIFDPHNGSGQESTTHDKGYQVPKPTPDPQWGVSQFTGWYNAKSGGTKYEDAFWPHTLTGDITFHAQWKHPVTFHPLGGTSNGGASALEPKDVPAGETVAAPGTMTKTAGGIYLGEITGVDTLTVTFEGWYDNPAYSDDAWDFDQDTVNAPLDLYAKWSQPVVDIPIDPNKNIIENALAYINGHEAGSYTIVLDKAVSMSGSTPATINKANAVITLVGKGDEPTEISLTGTGSLFRVSAGELVLDNNITLVGSSSNNASLVRVEGSSAILTMKVGAMIKDNKSSGGGGGVYVNNGGSFTLDGGEISGNYAALDGGGVWVGVSSSFTMITGKISGNHVETTGYNLYGGGVVVFGSFIMEGGEISDNYVLSTSNVTSGGGVAVLNNNASFIMSDGTISGNYANRGGGVYVNGSGSFSKTGDSVICGDDDGDPENGNPTDNTATYGDTYGHAVYYTSGPRYRDKTLNSGDNISTSSDTGWGE